TSTMTLCHRYHRRAPTPTTTMAQRHHLCHSTQRSAYKHSVTPSTSTPHTTTRTTVSTKPAEMAPSPYTTSSRPSRAIVSPSLTCTRTRRLLCRPILDLYTPPPCAHRKTPSFLLSFPGQATRTWRVRRRRIAKAKQALYRYPMEYLEEVTTR
ncbi:hypothetical protein EV363DRAFT_1359215, partial [Boletus edulis]